MAAKKRRRKRKKKIEASKKLAYWAASVATLSAASSLLLSAFGRDPVGELTGTIFTACVGYLITYAGKSLGEKISRNRHRLDADGNPIEDPTVFSTIKVKGGITALGASVILINGVQVGRSVTIVGGGDPVIPWSVKNTTIKGNLWVSNVDTNWFGALFNKVGRNVVLLDITLVEDHPGASGLVYVVQNTIGRNLWCKGLSGVSGGFVPGSVNTVGGKALGQCAELAR